MNDEGAEIFSYDKLASQLVTGPGGCRAHKTPRLEMKHVTTQHSKHDHVGLHWLHIIF